MHSQRTRMSVLRRKIATKKLGFSLKTKQQIGDLLSNDKKRSHLSLNVRINPSSRAELYGSVFLWILKTK